MEQNCRGRREPGPRCVGQRGPPNRYGGRDAPRLAGERLLRFGAAGYFDSRCNLRGRHGRLHREQCKQRGEPVLQCRSCHFREHTTTFRHTWRRVAERVWPTRVEPDFQTKAAPHGNGKSIGLNQGGVRCEQKSCFSMVGRFRTQLPRFEAAGARKPNCSKEIKTLYSFTLLVKDRGTSKP